MKVLSISRNMENITELELAVRLRWPDSVCSVVSGGDSVIDALAHEPELVFISGDLPGMGLTEALRTVRRFTDVPLIVAD